jgi:hypothetical protein
MSISISIFIVLSAIMWTALFIAGCRAAYKTNDGNIIATLWLFIFGIIMALGWLIILEVIK